MSKMKITEEMEIHKEWIPEAHKQMLDTIPDFLAHLLNDYTHNYGTIVHAVAAGMIATLSAMNKAEQGGITGFQASCLWWELMPELLMEKPPVKLIVYEDLLYPQYAYKFQPIISPKLWEWVQEEAKKKLADITSPVHPNVKAHWESIVDGKVPFGLMVRDDE